MVHPATTFEDIELGNMPAVASPASSLPPSDHVITTNKPYKFIFSVAHHEVEVNSVGRGGAYVTKHQTTVHSLTHRPWLTIPLFVYTGLSWIFFISAMMFACIAQKKFPSVCDWLGIIVMTNLCAALPMMWLLVHIFSRRTSGFPMWTYIEDYHVSESSASCLQSDEWYENREESGDYVKRSVGQLSYMYRRLSRFRNTSQMFITLNSMGAVITSFAMLITMLAVPGLLIGTSNAS